MNNYSDVKFIQSALTYTGGKYRLLPQIVPHFPTEYERFVDLFAGSATVASNIACLNSDKEYLVNDKQYHVIDFFKYLTDVDIDTLVNNIEEKIIYYGLSDSKRKGYDFYGSDNPLRLARYNKEKFIRLRDDYNNCPDTILFYLLVVFGFNNQIRFNNKGRFNMPVGRYDFNSRVENKLKQFHKCLNEHNFTFSSKDFRDIQIKNQILCMLTHLIEFLRLLIMNVGDGILKMT